MWAVFSAGANPNISIDFSRAHQLRTEVCSHYIHIAQALLSVLSRLADDGRLNLSTLLRLISLSCAALKSCACNWQQSDKTWGQGPSEGSWAKPWRSILSSGRDFKIKDVIYGEAVDVA